MHILPIGKGRKLNEGEVVAVLSIGPIGNEVAKAVAQAKELGYQVAHYDMIYLKPLDCDILQEVAERYKTVITVEDGTITGGMGTAVAAWMSTHGANITVHKIGIPDRFIKQGSPEELYAECGINEQTILQLIVEEFKKDRQ